MRTDTEALKDRLHAVLREAGENEDYLSTREIGERAGEGWIEFVHNPAHHDDMRFSHCLGGRDYLRAPLSHHPRVLRMLHIMEKQGLVYRAEVQAPVRSVYWAYVENFALYPMPIEDLEEAWTMEAHDHG